MKRPPRLLFSELTGSVYVVTRYTAKPHPTNPSSEIIIAQRKYDVSGDFDAAMVLRLKHIRRQARQARKKAS